MRSPFLQLKKEFTTQIAGVPFEPRSKPASEATSDNRSDLQYPAQPEDGEKKQKHLNRPIHYNGSFQLNKDAVISDQSIASILNSKMRSGENDEGQNDSLMMQR